MSRESWPTTQYLELRIKVRHSGPPLPENELLMACDISLRRSDLQLVSFDTAPPRVRPPTLWEQFLNVISAAMGATFLVILGMVAVGLLLALGTLVLGWF